MIDINRFYDMAPELQAKKKSRRVFRPATDQDSIKFLHSKQSFRTKLLQNLEKFRHHKESLFDTKIYNCPSKKSVLSIQSTRNPSSLSHFSMEEFNFSSEKKSKKVQKAQKIEKSLMDSLVFEKSLYQNEIVSRLKSTLPRFLESSRKKALRKIV